MRSLLLRFVAMTLLLPGVAICQSDNVGLYSRLYDTANSTVWQLEWSDYVPDADQEPAQYGDFITMQGVGGGWCDPVTNVCYDPHGTGGPEPLDDNYPLPTEYVTGLRIAPNVRISVWFTMQQGGSGGSGEPALRNRPSPLPPSCNSGEANVDGNQDDLIDAWEMSDYVMNQRVRESNSYPAQENVFFILPNQTVQFVQVGAIIGGPNHFTTVNWVESTACGVDFGPVPAQWPPGTIMGHVHPWSNGDDQTSACGLVGGLPRPLYTNGPGTEDLPALTLLGIDKGVIIDADGVYIFEDDGNGNAETEQSRRCH